MGKLMIQERKNVAGATALSVVRRAGLQTLNSWKETGPGAWVEDLAFAGEHGRGKKVEYMDTDASTWVDLVEVYMWLQQIPIAN